MDAHRLEVFDALRTAAGVNVREFHTQGIDDSLWITAIPPQPFNARDFANTLWAMVKISNDMPDVFEALRMEAAQVQNFNAQEFANTLWAMVKISNDMPDVFEALRMEAAQQCSSSCRATSAPATMCISSRCSTLSAQQLLRTCWSSALKTSLTASGLWPR